MRGQSSTAGAAFHNARWRDTKHQVCVEFCEAQIGQAVSLLPRSNLEAQSVLSSTDLERVGAVSARARKMRNFTLAGVMSRVSGNSRASSPLFFLQDESVLKRVQQCVESF